MNRREDKRFYDDWVARFKRERNRFITPRDNKVVSEARSLNLGDTTTKKGVVESVWHHVHNSVEYELTKEWQEPRDLLSRSVGDCEDMDFLAASIMMALGIESVTIVIGDISNTDEDVKHSWLEVDKRTVDPTADVGEIGHLKYKPRARIKVKKEDRSVKNKLNRGNQHGR